MNVTFVEKYYMLLYTHSLHVHQIFSSIRLCVLACSCAYVCMRALSLSVLLSICKMSRKLWLAFIKRSENVTPNNMVFCARQVYGKNTPVAKNNI